MQTTVATASATRSASQRADADQLSGKNLASAAQFHEDKVDEDDPIHQFYVEAGDVIYFWIPEGTPLARADVAMGGNTLNLTAASPSGYFTCGGSGILEAKYTQNLQFRHMRGGVQIDPAPAPASRTARGTTPPATEQPKFQAAPMQRDDYLQGVDRQSKSYARMSELQAYRGNVDGATRDAAARTNGEWEKVQFALDIIGIFDQSGFSDVASGCIALAMGDYSGAFWSALAVVPFAGALAVLPKIEAYLARHGLSRILAAIREGGAGALSAIERALGAVKRTMIEAVERARSTGASLLEAFGSAFDQLGHALDNALEAMQHPMASLRRQTRGDGAVLAAKGEKYLPKTRSAAMHDLLQHAEDIGAEIVTGREADDYLNWAASREGLDPENFHAVTLGDLVFVRDAYANDVRVLREELVHVLQQKGMTKATSVVEMEIEARLLLIQGRNTFALTHDEIALMIQEVRQMRSTGKY